MPTVHPRPWFGLPVALLLLGACAGPPAPSPPAGVATGEPAPSARDTATPQPSPTRLVHTTESPVRTGEPIDVGELHGRIVTDDFEDVYAFDPDGSGFLRIADAPGSEFDASWSPDGTQVVYRDSTRGINEDDELFVARADGSQRRNITNDRANDWGPDWSPDGTTIAFNSDRDGGIRGYLVDPDGTNLRRIDVDAWLEYPSWSPGGTRLAFMGAIGANYEIFTVDLATGEVRQLTDSPGGDGWPAWSPDGSTIVFSSLRDDCRFAEPGAACWQGGPADEHHDVWAINPDGTGLRRVTPEAGQFVAWSPDGRHLLISGRALYVVRPDGTGRLELRTPEVSHALGGIPDWTP